jgi:uncharacterized DUF497 family protein
MKFTWDEKKRRATLQARRLDFADVEKVFIGETFTWEDTRYGYGERRFITLGMLDAGVVVLVHTETEDHIHVISLRKADKHEQDLYFKNAGIHRPG